MAPALATRTHTTGRRGSRVLVAAAVLGASYFAFTSLFVQHPRSWWPDAAAFLPFGRSLPASVTALRAAMATPETVSVNSPLLRAVVSDVDGTLFHFGCQNQLSAANAAALRRAIAAGVHVSLATGRIPGPWSGALGQQLPGMGPGIFANGALILGPVGGEVLEETFLPAEVVAIVKDFSRGGLAGGKGRVALLAATRLAGSAPEHGSLCYAELAPSGPTWVTELVKGAGEPAVQMLDLDSVADDRVMKFVFFTTRKDADWACMPDVVAELKARLAGTGSTVLACGALQCEVLPLGINKGAAVERLLSRLGVAPSATLACGDAENDVEMLRLVGVGAAMGNAGSKAKEAADVVVSRHDHDGVAEAIQRFVFGEQFTK
ncbi:unnamed protein product [Polarella glacialis]|uniref:Sugar-phosphatase n=1 Tax=Polarella glacialis TaxID=89957 RepID=A0A813DDQ4_POLGL|nr:unnamed protein product [Polarella glacialis]